MTFKLSADGVDLDLTLIPEGTAIIGVPGPESPMLGYLLGGVGGLVLGALTVSVWLRRRRTKHLQFGLRWLILACISLSVFGWGLSTCVQHKIRHKRFGSARPEEEVRIEKPFYMGRFEVTQGQYKAVTHQTLDKAPSHKGDDQPEYQCSFQGAQVFCELLSTRCGKRIRLPTELEWEYACRAGRKGPLSVDRVLAMGWVRENTKTLMPVGSKEPNEWGLYDMLGNAEEWCSDRFERTNGDPCRVVKGGSIHSPASSLETLNRSFFPESGYLEGAGGLSAGFRVVCEIEDRPPPPSAPSGQE